MRRRRKNTSNLQLEMLESRVMLAASDGFDPGATAGGQELGIESNARIAIELFPYGEHLTITGEGQGNLTVNLDLLPDSVDRLVIGSFDSVTLLGAASITVLSISDVEKVDAGAITVESLYTFDVEHVRIENAPANILLQGARDASGLPTLGERTLLEVDRFSSSPLAYIFAAVKNLGIATSSTVIDLPDISVASSILLNFEPSNAPRVQEDVEVSVIRGGDFKAYFFGSAEDRAQIEQSPAVTRSLADVERVPLAALLQNPNLRAALIAGLDGAAAQVHTRPLYEGSVDSATFALDTSVEPQTSLALDLSQSTSRVVASNDTSWLLITADNVNMVIADMPADSVENRAVGMAGPDDASTGSVVNTAPSETELTAISTLLARLSEPFVQTVFNLQGHFASFGAIASAQVTDQMRSDNRPVLLADARPARQREADETIIVSV